MPQLSLRKKLLNQYMHHILLRDSLLPPPTDALEQLEQLNADMEIFKLIRDTRYILPRSILPKAGFLHLAFDFMHSDPDQFQQMLRLSPLAFNVLLELIKDHPQFHNNSNNPQAPVIIQLSLFLYRMGRYGNAASTVDLARSAGIGEGTVIDYTNRCLIAIESLHSLFVRALTDAEKETEKKWIDERIGFVGLWREGFVMYDGTIVPLFEKPTMYGDAYFSRKSNYGLNVQVILLL